jgi:ribosome biogenesis GTPase
MLLSPFGWDSHFSAARAAASTAFTQTLEPARVVAANRGIYRLFAADGEREGFLAGDLIQLDGAARPITGDWVAVETETGRIRTLLPRRTAIVRKRVGRATEAQLVAANVDVLFIVMGLDGDYNLRRLERYLFLAAESRAKPIVVLNKSDLCEDPLARIQEVGKLTSEAVIVMSAIACGSVAQLHAHIEPGQTAALVGSSGAGKSTIVNALLGRSRQATSEVRAGDSRGRHTTTGRELFLLPAGWLLIDTPGMRELEVWSNSGGAEHAFSSIAELAANCRFRDCRHAGEPGCAVEQAVADGVLDADQLENLHKLDREANAQEAKRRERILGRAQAQMYRRPLREKWE